MKKITNFLLLFFIFALGFAVTPATSAISVTKPASGFYRAEGRAGEIADIIIHSDGTGSFEIEEESNPFNWNMQGNKIIFQMFDTSLPPEHRKYEANLENGSSFVMDDLKYQRDNDIKIETYEYMEKGFSGTLYLTDWGSKGEEFNIKIATVNDASTNICEAEVACKNKGAMLLCKDSNNEDPEAILTIKFENKDILDVNGTLSRSEYCGNGGDFFGSYNLIP